MQDYRHKIRYLIFTWAYLECLGYSGIVFGWGSLVYVLKEEGLYGHLCQEAADVRGTLTNGTQGTSKTSSKVDLELDCDARDAMFNLVFTIATAVLGVGVFILGLVNLRYGTRVTRLAASVIFVTGSLCMATASPDIPWLIFPGLSLIAVAGSAILATNVQVSFLFPVWGSAVLSLLSGTFDASAGVQLLIKVGYENGISRSTSYYILAGVFTLTLVNSFLFLPKHFIQKQLAPEPLNDKVKIEDGGNQDKKQNGDTVEGEQLIQIKHRNVINVIISPEFLFHMFWAALLNLRHINYQASVNTVLEDTLHTDSQVSQYTNIYMYTLLSGTIVSFLPGLVYDLNVKLFHKSESPTRRRLMPSVFPLILTSMIGTLLSLCTLFTGPNSLYVEFVLIVFLRAFLYSTLATYIRQLFPSELFATLYGILLLVAGLVGLLQNALFAWADNHGNKQVLIFLLVLCVTTVVHPLYQWKKCR